VLTLGDADNYTSSFGKEWTVHAQTQLDKFNGTHISRDRFFEYTKWPTDLRGQLILEAGSGSGRFTQVMLDAGARVVSIDYSAAVHANAQNNGQSDRLTLFRGDIYRIPFLERSFDRVVCIGVLQHTPDPRAAFGALVKMVKPGGVLAADIYRLALVSLLHPKYYWRPVRHLLTDDQLLQAVRWLTPRLLPVKAALRRLPLLGVPLAHVLVPVPDYRGRLPLSEAQAAIWSELDLFDMIAPQHDHPATLKSVRRWCREASLEDVDIAVVSKGWQIAVRGRAGSA
jgi:SAM-dependent methyltransferase